MTFHFLNKYMMRKIITTIIRPKLEYAEVIWSLQKKKQVLKLGRIEKNNYDLRYGVGAMPATVFLFLI